MCQMAAQQHKKLKDKILKENTFSLPSQKKKKLPFKKPSQEERHASKWEERGKHEIKKSEDLRVSLDYLTDENTPRGNSHICQSVGLNKQREQKMPSKWTKQNRKTR